MIVPLFRIEAGSAAARATLRICGERPLLSEYAAGEVSSTFARLARMGQITAEAGRARLDDFDAWRAAQCAPCPLDDDDLKLATALVRRFTLGLRLPDAIHLAACARRRLTLVTADRLLADAAGAIDVRTIIPGQPAPA